MDTILKLLGLPSPGVLLGVVAAILISGVIGTGTGAYLGYQWERRSHAAAVLAAQNEAIDQANRDVEAAVALAVEQAKREADARVRAAGVRRKGEIDATAKARPECARDADSQRLLLDAIDLANGTQADPSTMSDAVRPTSQPSK